jgi:hypothetical protein
MRARAQKKHTRNAAGLSPGVLLSRGEIAPLHEMNEKDSIAAADRPAGTRVALPGSMCGIFIPRCEAEAPPQSLRSAFQLRSKAKPKTLCRGGACSARPTRLGANLPRRNLKRVRQHLLRLQPVRFAHQRQLLQLAHAARSLCAQDVPLARVRANNFAGRRHLKPLRGAAVRLQFQLWFGSVSWHF